MTWCIKGQQIIAVIRTTGSVMIAWTADSARLTSYGNWVSRTDPWENSTEHNVHRGINDFFDEVNR